MPDNVAPNTSDLHFLTITEAASLIERRQLSPGCVDPRLP